MCGWHVDLGCNHVGLLIKDFYPVCGYSHQSQSLTVLFLVAYCMGVSDLLKKYHYRVLVIFWTGQNVQLVLGCVLLTQDGLQWYVQMFCQYL